MNREVMRKIVQEDLRVQPYCLQKRQLLSDAMVEKRLVRAMVLRNWLKSRTQVSIIWMDEKIFAPEAAFNSHNDSIWPRTLQRFQSRTGQPPLWCGRVSLRAGRSPPPHLPPGGGKGEPKGLPQHVGQTSTSLDQGTAMGGLVLLLTRQSTPRPTWPSLFRLGVSAHLTISGQRRCGPLLLQTLT